MLVTALVPYIGYDKAAMAAKIAYQDKSTLKDAVMKLNLMSSSKFDMIVKPEDMINPS
jgi:fumarate hydratase class II